MSSARAIAMRWRWPPDSSTPRSPTMASQPQRLLAYELENMGRRRGTLDRRVGHVAPEGDVVADGVVEQHYVLAHDRDLLAQVGELIVAHVDAVDAHRCRCPRRRSAAAGSPASTCRCRSGRRWRSLSPGAHTERDIVERRRPARRAAPSVRAAFAAGRRTTRPRTRPHRAPARRGGRRRAASLGSSSSSNRLWPAATPCCSGPATPTSSRSGCAMPISATKKPMQVPDAHAPVDRVGDAPAPARPPGRSRSRAAPPGSTAPW